MKISLIVTIVLASTPSMSAPSKGIMGFRKDKMVVTNGITGVTDKQFFLCRTREQNMVSWKDAPLEECTKERLCKTGRTGKPLQFRFDECLDEKNYVIWRMSCNDCWNNNTIYMYKHQMTAEKLQHGKEEQMKWAANLYFCTATIAFNAEYLFNIVIVLYNLFV